MKKIILIIGFLLISINQTFSFLDIENNWYKESINALKEKGVVNGYTKNKFGPNNNISRSEILKILFDISNTEIKNPEKKCFKDVDLNSWQAKYICTAFEKGIAKGYGNDIFKPNGEVSVLEVLAFAIRIFEIDLKYYDNGGKWYEKYQQFADENKIIPIHNYTISNLASRGLSSDIIYRMSEYKNNKKLDYKSLGCDGKSVLKSGEYSVTINGKNRKYLLYVPAGTTSKSEKSLIVAFHGRTNSNDMVRDYMQLGGGKYGKTNKQNDFIVAYPSGMGTGPYSWYDYENIEFFDAIVSKVSDEICINRDEVFTVGHSLGSWMSNKTSCLRGDVVRGMVGVASTGYNKNCIGAVSSLIMHLKGDPLASYSGGGIAFGYKSENNLCSSETKSINLGSIRSCKTKQNCSKGNSVTFCNSYSTYGNDLHSWPKDGASDILDFFKSL